MTDSDPETTNAPLDNLHLQLEPGEVVLDGEAKRWRMIALLDQDRRLLIARQRWSIPAWIGGSYYGNGVVTTPTRCWHWALPASALPRLAAMLSEQSPRAGVEDVREGRVRRMEASEIDLSLSADPSAARILIADGLRHDEAMTKGPWETRPVDSAIPRIVSEASGFGVADTLLNADAAGIAWLRTHARTLLTGYSQALDEVERWEAAKQVNVEISDGLTRRVAEQNGELIRLRAVLAALTEQHDVYRSRAQELANRIAELEDLNAAADRSVRALDELSADGSRRVAAADNVWSESEIAEIQTRAAELAHLFVGQFSVSIVTRNPDNWQARGLQRATYEEAERDVEKANAAASVQVELTALTEQLDVYRSRAQELSGRVHELRTALTALIARVRKVGGYATPEEQQVLWEAERVVGDH